MPDFSPLTNFISRIPGINPGIGTGEYEDKTWWVKFKIDITHELSWNIVQELGHILNYISLEEKLPTKFYPVSPPPYMNGGPVEFLSWIIESLDPDFTPNDLQKWLEGRLPDPVDKVEEWLYQDEDE